MAFLRRSSWFGYIIMMLFICSACSVTTIIEDSESGADIGQSDISYEEIAVAAVETALKGRLKNPESLQIHNATVEEDYYEDDSVYFCAVTVDYSAQNGFGGYNRDVLKSYIRIAKSTGAITELDEISYINQWAEAQFAEGLSSVGEGIPLQLIFSDDNYSSLLPNIIGNGKISSTFTYPSGDKEVSYISSLDDLEGTVTFYFHSGSEKTYQISFYWSDGQSFYDGTNAYTLGTKHTATVEDIGALRMKIDDALEISHSDIKETAETYFRDYECRWDMAEGIHIKLSWSVHDADGIIGHIQLLATNEVNGAAE